jgi:hypothetical protein
VIPVTAIAAAALLSAAQAAPAVEEGGQAPARDPDAAVIENLELLERLELLQHLDVLITPAPVRAPEEPPAEPPPRPPPPAPPETPSPPLPAPRKP